MQQWSQWEKCPPNLASRSEHNLAYIVRQGETSVDVSFTVMNHKLYLLRTLFKSRDCNLLTVNKTFISLSLHKKIRVIEQAVDIDTTVPVEQHHVTFGEHHDLSRDS